MTARLRSRLARASRALLLGAAALFYLQFGLQAMFHSPPQGVLTLVGALALGWAAVRTPRKWSRSAIVLAGTLPLLVLHAVFTLIDLRELPFLIGSAPVPVIAGAVWILTRSSSSDGLATEEVEIAKDGSPIQNAADNTWPSDQGNAAKDSLD